MSYIINCGEQDIENDGICISMTYVEEGKVHPDVMFIHFIDNLLGISEFITDCDYKYAEVGIDVSGENVENQESLKDFNLFLSKKENQDICEILKKYVDYEFEEVGVEGGLLWYTFTIYNTGEAGRMKEEDQVKFCKIFKERVK